MPTIMKDNNYSTFSTTTTTKKSAKCTKTVALPMKEKMFF